LSQKSGILDRGAIYGENLDIMHQVKPSWHPPRRWRRWIYGSVWFAFASWASASTALPPLDKSDFNNVHAIVQLQGLDVPKPQVKGSGTLTLKVLDRTQVFTTVGMLGELPGRFLIDTGASTTMLSAQVVEDLKLTGRPVPSDRLSSAVAGKECSSMKATLHELPNLKLESVNITGINALQFETTTIPDGLSGVMGMDILSNFDLQFNPKALTLQLTSPSPLPQESSGTTIPLQRKLGVFLAKLTLNGQGPFTMLLDTGADSTFISKPVAQKLKLDAKQRQPMQILGFCGLEPAERSRLTSVKLGQQEQTGVEAIILSSPILKLLGVDGILGQNFLSHYQQHWRFTPFAKNGAKADGSLLLSGPESTIK
jgi:predicted aspartyl protease